MKARTLIAALSFAAALAVSSNASAQTTKYITVDGEVVRYEPGRIIVIRNADNKEFTYSLSPTITVPAEVKTGRHVTLFTEPSPEGGTAVVTRVTTTSITPEGNVKRTTEDTKTQPSGATTKTTTTQITGTIQAYVPGKTLTITRADGTQATYLITGDSRVPSDLAIGKQIAIIPTTTASGETVIRTITYVPIR